MGVAVYVGIGLVLVLGMIGLLIGLSRNAAITGSNKRISIAIGALQVVYIILYSMEDLSKMGQANVYFAFGVSAVISIVCFLLSIWIVLPFAKFKHGIKYLFMFFSILQVLITIVVFLLPEAGIPAPIQF